MIEKIKELKNFVLLKEKNINKEKNKGAIKKAETKTWRRKIISSQKSVLNSASNLFDKSGVIIDEFMNKNILPGDLEKDVHQKEEPEHELSIAERTRIRRQN